MSAIPIYAYLIIIVLLFLFFGTAFQMAKKEHGLWHQVNRYNWSGVIWKINTSSSARVGLDVSSEKPYSIQLFESVVTIKKDGVDLLSTPKSLRLVQGSYQSTLTKTSPQTVIVAVKKGKKAELQTEGKPIILANGVYDVSVAFKGDVNGKPLVVELPSGEERELIFKGILTLDNGQLNLQEAKKK